MNSIPSVAPVSNTVLVTPVQPIRPVAPTGTAQQETGVSGKPRSANAPGVGRLLDMRV
jgi:hypothetical protein